MPAYLVDTRERCPKNCGRYATHEVHDFWTGASLGRFCWSCSQEIVMALAGVKATP